MKVLVVDDDEGIRALLRLKLKKAGYEAHFAENGKIGVQKALELKPDLILMDWQMPKMCGEEATRILRKQEYDGLIVAFTASGITGERQRMLDAGSDHLIIKPPEKDFIPTIANFLQKGRQKSQ